MILLNTKYLGTNYVWIVYYLDETESVNNTLENTKLQALLGSINNKK